MDSPWRPQSGVLCETCAQIDFADLFTRSHKMYALSTLQDMAGRGDSPNGSPACKLFLDAIASAWKTTPDWIAQLERPIRCWIRSMFWAQHCSDTVSYESHASRHNRAILGTDWHPHEMSFHWNPTLARFTAAALDLVNEFASETLVANHAQRQLDQFAVDSFGDADELIARRLLKGTMDLTIICSWLSECQTFHTHSHSKGLVDMSQLGSSRVRVVDVVRRRLVERGAPFRYVALSYVWGNSTSQISLERVFDADLRIRMHRLPNSIYDAIKLTRALGERYLWVDWLCIDQADAAAKALLISHMDAIYQSACFTIVAAAGIDADAGLPGLFTRQRREELATSLPTRSGRILLTQSRPSLYSILQDSKWNTRGWTYQEQLLSSNRLIFTDREVFYTCPHHHSDEIPIRNKDTPHASFHYSYFSYWREAYRLETRFTRIMTQSHVDWSKGFEREADPKVEHQLSSPASELDRFAQYVQHIHEYTKRNLTNGDDAVAAFAGVLSKIWSDIELKTTLRHGLPMPSLARSLLWHAVDTSSFSKRRATGPFPSWSWAGWEGQIAHASRDVFLLESERSSTSLGSGIAAAMRILYRPPYDKRPKAGHLEFTELLESVTDSEGSPIVLLDSLKPIDKRPEVGSNPNHLILGTGVLQATTNDLSENAAIQIEHAPEGGGKEGNPYKWTFVAVARGIRKLEYRPDSDVDISEVVALVVEPVGGHYERRGIACIEESVWPVVTDPEGHASDSKWIVLR